MLKRLFSIITIYLVLTGSFFSAYNIEYPVYADDNTDSWTQVTTNEQLAEAFRYYCKSRDLTIEGSLADGLTSFTTSAFNGLCNTLGIDITSLQANIKYQTDGNLGTKFLFNALSIDAYNRIFAQFLQDNELSVGDTVNEKTLYSGKAFLDYYGNSILVTYIRDSDFKTENFNISPSNIRVGTPVNGMDSKFYSQFLGQGNDFWTCEYTTYTNAANTSTTTWHGRMGANRDDVFYGIVVYSVNGNPNGFASIIYRYERDAYYFGLVSYNSSTDKYANAVWDTSIPIYPKNNNVQNCNIYITTNNNTINNNTYEGDTIINNNGDTNYYPDTPDDPDLPPSNPTIPDSGGWKDFSLPDMPNDWLIYGMEKKFPFDIPFNILFALSLLNHEPEIPKFEGDIDLQVCTWHYDIDLTPFDDIATILRKFEVLGFIIGLAILTKNLINWG